MLPLEERLMDAARDVCLRLNDQLTDCNSLQRLSETVERAVETALGVQCCTLLVLQEGGILQRWAEHKGRAPTLAPHLCLSFDRAAQELPPLADLQMRTAVDQHGGIASVDAAAMQVATLDDDDLVGDLVGPLDITPSPGPLTQRGLGGCGAVGGGDSQPPASRPASRPGSELPGARGLSGGGSLESARLRQDYLHAERLLSAPVSVRGATPLVSARQVHTPSRARRPPPMGGSPVAPELGFDSGGGEACADADRPQTRESDGRPHTRESLRTSISSISEPPLDHHALAVPLIALEAPSRPCGQLLGCVHLRGGPLPASLLLEPLRLIASHLAARLRAAIHNQRLARLSSRFGLLPPRLGVAQATRLILRAATELVPSHEAQLHYLEAEMRVLWRVAADGTLTRCP